jgi:membrane protease subunit HflK
MARNQSAGVSMSKNDKDPWGGKQDNQTPPDLDEVIKKLQDKLANVFGNGSGSGSGNADGNSMKLIGGVALLSLLAWFVFGFYQVSQSEEGVVLRFGSYSHSVGPGLHWNPPLIDRVYKVNIERIESMNLRADMLTLDENIVEVALVVQYRIGSAKDYILEISNPEAGLHNATESALRHVVGSTSMSDVITEGREVMGQQVQKMLQDILNRYHAGMDIRKVSIQDSDPPKAVKASFDDVIKAKEDKERLKNEAESYANSIIPEARGFAQREMEEASAYRDETIARAEGQSNRFLRVLDEYKKAPEVTRQRLYLETMEDIFTKTSKIMVDVDGGNNMIYLPLDKIMNNSAKNESTSAYVSPDTDAAQSTSLNEQRINDRVRAAQDIRRRELR